MTSRTIPFALVLAFVTTSRGADPIAIDMSGYRPGRGVEVHHLGDKLSVIWPTDGGGFGLVLLDLTPGQSLFHLFGLARDRAGKDAIAVARRVDPAYFLTVGARVEGEPRPPGMSPFNTFFDSPAKRPHTSHHLSFTPKGGRVTSRPGRVSVHLDGLTLGPFAGGLDITVYAGERLVQIEAVVSTAQDNVAYFYDAGLVGDTFGLSRKIRWVDTEGQECVESASPSSKDRPIAARHRLIWAASENRGTLAILPPPHQYFSPRDSTDNLGTVWFGRGHRGVEDRFGMGIRQVETGGGSYSPWVNAPPGSEQRLKFFIALGRQGEESAATHALRYTRDDRFAPLPGHVTFTSHWHMATAVAAMKEIAAGKPRATPDFVKMFKDMGVQIVHLAEFHGDGHPQDPGPQRLPELTAMFDECRRLSDKDLLFLPGEEANVHYKATPKGSQPGHWLYLFPKPVRWIMSRKPGEPFAEERPGGTVYRVGNREDMLRLMETEHGLAWTAHARIKASTWTPDGYRDEPFFKSPTWLGAAWKAMPADYSQPRLGSRVLDLFDDMANWGGHKYVVGEVDVFKLDHTHELYGHMNINYVRLDKLPKFDEGWQPLLDALKAGKFFVTTGEILIRDFSLGGVPSGGTIKGDTPSELRLDLEWTFPLNFAEVISGDGKQVYRERIDLTDTGAFGKRTIAIRPNLKGRTWARVEVWDVAVNGAFTQPVWIDRP